MARPPAWRHTLDEARRQALVAIDFYNRPGARRSFSDFIVHIHLAWQNLIHADRMKRKAEIVYRESGPQRRFKRNPDGSKKTWDLTQCLKFEFNDNDPIRRNIEFFIGLRNHVEHRFQDSVLVVTAAEAHACIINFEAELIRRFSAAETLGHELKFPVFVQSLTPARYEEQRELRRALPSGIATFITEFQQDLSEELRSNERFAYRLLLIPMKGPKTDADMALNFVRQDDLSEDELKQLLGQQGSVIVAEKYREAAHGDEMLPKAAAENAQGRIPFKFSVNDFTALRKIWEIGPLKSGSKEQLPKSDGFCVYSPAFKQFVYRPTLVDRIVAALDTAEKYQTALGRSPVAKVSPPEPSSWYTSCRSRTFPGVIASESIGPDSSPPPSVSAHWVGAGKSTDKLGRVGEAEAVGSGQRIQQGTCHEYSFPYARWFQAVSATVVLSSSQSN